MWPFKNKPKAEPKPLYRQVVETRVLACKSARIEIHLQNETFVQHAKPTLERSDDRVCKYTGNEISRYGFAYRVTNGLLKTIYAYATHANTSAWTNIENTLEINLDGRKIVVPREQILRIEITDGSEMELEYQHYSVEKIVE